jgi:hypothetical protein
MFTICSWYMALLIRGQFGGQTLIYMRLDLFARLCQWVVGTLDIMIVFNNW